MTNKAGFFLASHNHSRAYSRYDQHNLEIVPKLNRKSPISVQIKFIIYPFSYDSYKLMLKVLPYRKEV